MDRFKVISVSGYKIFDTEKNEYWYCVYDYFTEEKNQAISDCTKMNNLYKNSKDLVNKYNYLLNKRKRYK